MNPEQRSIAERRITAKKAPAEFEALLHTMKAQDEGLIGRKNTLKIDE